MTKSSFNISPKIFRHIYFFFYQGFLSQTLTIHRTAGKRGDHCLFHSTTSTRSRTFRDLFATLHVRWLSRIFNRNACVYQTATRWNLPPYRLTIWLIDWLIMQYLFVCLFDELIVGFCDSDFDIGNRWIWTRINYHPCITSEPTNLFSNFWSHCIAVSNWIRKDRDCVLLYQNI